MSERTVPVTSYRVFTHRFDRVVPANSLRSPTASERAWELFMEQTLERRTAWELHGLEHSGRIRTAVSDETLQDTLVTLLVDHSGSMRGERMLLTAAAVDVARSFLIHLGVGVEILGFTTRSWKGGWSRRLWRWMGRRKNPGRLCDLLHIVYEPAYGRHAPGTGLRSLVHMFDPQLLKENVDGEAILWAASRQDAHSQQHKAIVVISDGAPVDDSTLLANGLTFLVDHLREVVASLQESRTMAQLQIGCEAESFFPLVARVDTLHDLGAALFGLLDDVLLRLCAREPNVG
jgi:cobaltochelatase CobT